MGKSGNGETNKHGVEKNKEKMNIILLTEVEVAKLRELLGAENDPNAENEENEVATPKRRGRPRMEPVEDMEVPPDAAPKRRGRPRKTEPNVPVESLTERRGRGRPRKAAEEPLPRRGRGLPSEDSQAWTEEDEEALNSPETVVRRARPATINVEKKANKASEPITYKGLVKLVNEHSAQNGPDDIEALFEAYDIYELKELDEADYERFAQEIRDLSNS